MLAKGRQRPAKARTPLNGSRAADAPVEVAGEKLDTLTEGPRVERRGLCFGPKPLFISCLTRRYPLIAVLGSTVLAQSSPMYFV